MAKLTFQTDLGVSIEKNGDCPTCSICWDCDIKVKDCKYFNGAIKKLAKYEAIGTVEEFKALKEKNEPKQADLFGDGYADGHLVYDTYECPNCGEQYELEYEEYKHCPECGQAIKIGLEGN